ncbi:hypothetical protein M569_15928 [Genlisea aurea]|uniref:Malectin-like domain-containing protein n=1 Tax=Genlisea aurea TaxID=192259 RepID=S8DHR6_9LAMI|nr:hypothetical protein M569_15928 [Genlisea aurea]
MLLLLPPWVVFAILYFQVVGVSICGGEFSAGELDSLLQEYAFGAFVRPRTGVVYNATLPVNLTGIEVAALRLRSGSLLRRGVSRYNEFQIPAGVVVQPYVVRLVLVYQNLGNFSPDYYPVPGYSLLTPVLGLLAYDAANLSATNLSELDIRASGEPISIRFPNVVSGRITPKPKCLYFGLDGSLGFDNVVNGSTCLTNFQGHFSIAVESSISPVPAPSPSPATPAGGGGGGGGGDRKREWIIIGSVIGGLLVLSASLLAAGCIRKCLTRKRMRRMEEAAESGVALPMATVANTRAPVATGTRTRPSLENELFVG